MPLSPKEDLLNRIINIYGGNMTRETKKEWFKACDEVLKGDIDYRRLWQEFLYEFDTKTIGNAPSPQWLYRASRNCLIETEKPFTELPKGVPCPPEVKKKIQETLQKIKEKTL